MEHTTASLEEEGKTAMLVALNSSVIGVLAVADQAKREAASTVAALHKLGLQVHILTTTYLYIVLPNCATAAT